MTKYLRKKQGDLQRLVDAYIQCGSTHGYAIAESILMKYLPKNKPDGKCYDVPRAKWTKLKYELGHYIQIS